MNPMPVKQLLTPKLDLVFKILFTKDTDILLFCASRAMKTFFTLVPKLHLGTQLPVKLRFCETEFRCQARSQTPFGNEEAGVWKRGNAD